MENKIKYQVGDIGFVYPNINNIWSCLIAKFTHGYFTHCFQIVLVDGDDVHICHSRFPYGIKSDLLHKQFAGRAFDIMRTKKELDMSKVGLWWFRHRNKRYDWLYYFGYPLRKIFHIQNPFAYTCNEAIIGACKADGVKLKGSSPTKLAKDKELEYVITMML
jgi:hypothetical protein